jgi:exonuclease VII large subunit
LAFPLFLAITFVFSCGRPANDQATVEADQAHEEFRLFVTEQDRTNIEGREGFEDMEYERLMAARAARYDSLQARLDRNLDRVDETRRQEIAVLRSQYDTIQAKNTRAYRAYIRRRDIRQNLLGVSTERDDLSGIIASELPSRYQMFVNRVEENRPTYTEEDWEVVEGLWSALETRRQQVEADLNRPARNDIERARNRYLSIREEMRAAAVPRPE